MDILPSANPQNSSKIQRIQKAQAQLAVMPQVQATGGNPQPIVEDYLDAIGSESVDEIYPELTPEQQEAAQAKQAENEALEKQLRFLPVKAQADIGEAEKNNSITKRIEAEIKQAKTISDIKLNEAKVLETEASALLKKELAETEESKNAGTIIDSEIKVDKANREAELDRLDREKLNEQAGSSGTNN